MDGFKKDERFLDAIADADSFPYWFDDVDEPESNPMLVHDERCDLISILEEATHLHRRVLTGTHNCTRL